MKPTPTLPQSVIDFADFLNEPPQYEDLRMVRDYRHEAWAKFEKVISDLSAALSVPAAAVVGEPVPSLETLQYYRDAHSDKFGWVKAPIRVVEDACGTLELLIAENAKFRKALKKIAERADDNLPMYTPGAMVHTAEEALGGASHD